MRPVELFHIGPQKSGTTWIYRCLREHPRVGCPAADAIHYFDMHYTRGRGWYAASFAGAGEDQALFDPTYTYIRSTWAPRRIALENPRARIALCLRHPLERAFSHYWHEKKKGKQRFEFAEVLRNYDLFASWLEPGLYAEAIERYLEHFDREQLLCQRYEDLEADPASFLDELLVFFGLAPGFRPSVLRQRINVAGRKRGWLGSWLQPRLGGALRRLAAGSGLAVPGSADAALSGRSEYLKGIPDDLLPPLLEICEPETARLEALLGVDLRPWRARPARRAGAAPGGS